ncbi:phage terminase large subunit family protein [Methylomonas sp. MgM2]
MRLNVADGYACFMEAFAEGLQPDPDLWVDEWSDQYMIIPKKAGAAEPGPYRTDRTPYAREVMRCLSPLHPCRRVVVMGASQMLKTQVALNWIGASIHQAPVNILALFPTERLVKRVSHRIGETLKAVPVLDERVAPPRSRDSRNTIDVKEFDGGTLHLATSRSAANLSEISCRYVYGDELDRWELDVQGEGDPIELAEARTSTFGFNAKIYFSSSPTIEGLSLIDKLFKTSDQRRYYVPCPHCSHMHTLEWERMHWNDDLTQAWMVCPECGATIEESHKTTMLAAGEWRAENPAASGATVGFTISQLYAPLGWQSWPNLVEKYVKAKQSIEKGDKSPMQVFYNTRLAKCFDAADERIAADALKKRAKDYPLRSVPKNCLELTCSVDVQGNRIEYMVMGWGEGLERWVIDYGAIMGSPAEEDVWTELDKILMTPLYNTFGKALAIKACGIDTGGHYTQDVYQYTRMRRRRKVLALKGYSRPNRPVISGKPSLVDLNWRGQVQKHGAELWMVGTDTAKDWMLPRWLFNDGPGAIHFSNQLSDDFYHQLTAERKLIKYRKGHAISEWFKQPGEANEALDLCVYNLAMAHFLGLHKRRPNEWERLREQLQPNQQDIFSLATAQPDLQIATISEQAAPEPSLQGGANLPNPAKPAEPERKIFIPE